MPLLTGKITDTFGRIRPYFSSYYEETGLHLLRQLYCHFRGDYSFRIRRSIQGSKRERMIEERQYRSQFHQRAAVNLGSAVCDSRAITLLQEEAGLGV